MGVAGSIHSPEADQALLSAVKASDELEWARQARPNALPARLQQRGPESATDPHLPPQLVSAPLAASPALATVQIPGTAILGPDMAAAAGEKSLEITLAELRSRLMSAKKPPRPSEPPELAASATAAPGDGQNARASSAPLTNGTNGLTVMQVDQDLDGEPAVDELTVLKAHPLGKRMLEESVISIETSLCNSELPRSSSSSDSSSEDEADRPTKRPKPSEEPAAAAGGDDSDDDIMANGGIKTVNEVEEATVAPPPIAEVPAEYKLLRMGVTESAIGNVLVIRADTHADGRILDEGTLVCLEDRTALGIIFETLGSVKEPRHTVRFPSSSDTLLGKAPNGTTIFFVDDADFSAFVYPEALRQLPKGSDASNLFDEEVAPEEVEYSDDEQEAQAKRQQKQARRDRAQSRHVAGAGPAAQSRETSMRPPPIATAAARNSKTTAVADPTKATSGAPPRDAPSEAEDGEVSSDNAAAKGKEASVTQAPASARMDAFSPPPDEIATRYQRDEATPPQTPVTTTVSSVQTSAIESAAVPPVSASSIDGVSIPSSQNGTSLPPTSVTTSATSASKSIDAPSSQSAATESSSSSQQNILEKPVAPAISVPAPAPVTASSGSVAAASVESRPLKDRIGATGDASSATQSKASSKSTSGSSSKATSAAKATPAPSKTNSAPGSSEKSLASRISGGPSPTKSTGSSTSAKAHLGPSKDLRERMGLPARPKSVTPPQEVKRETRDHYSPPPRRASPSRGGAPPLVRRRTPPAVDVGKEERNRARQPSPPITARRHPGDYLDRYEPPPREPPRDLTPRDYGPPRDLPPREALPLPRRDAYDDYHRGLPDPYRGLPPPLPRRRSRSRSPERREDYGPPRAADPYRDYPSGYSAAMPWPAAYPAPSGSAPYYGYSPVDPYSPYAPGIAPSPRSAVSGGRYGAYPDYPPAQGRGDYLYGDPRAEPHGDRRGPPMPPPMRYDPYDRPPPPRDIDLRDRDLPPRRDYRDPRDLPPLAPPRGRGPYDDDPRPASPYPPSYPPRR